MGTGADASRDPAPPPDTAFGHLRRAAAALVARDLEAALAEATAAIELDPDAPDAYRVRSEIQRFRGDWVALSHDWSAYLAREPHASNREAIAAAAERLRRHVFDDPPVDGLEGGEARSAALREAVAARARERARRRQAFERPACSLPCPSLCCHFEHAPFHYGVCIDPEKLDALHALLASEGRDAERVVGRAPLSDCVTLGEERAARYAVDEAGDRVVYFPRATGAPVAGLTPRARPRRVDGSSLAWLNARARACAFVTARGCALHGIGDPPGPPGLSVCRAFLCLTGFVFLALETLGIICRSSVQGARSMEDLNDRAVAALLRVDGCLLTDPEVTSARKRRDESLAAALDADRRGDAARLHREFARYRDAIAELERLHAQRRETIRAAAAPSG